MRLDLQAFVARRLTGANEKGLCHSIDVGAGPIVHGDNVGLRGRIEQAETRIVSRQHD